MQAIRALRECLMRGGRVLLPLVELVERSESAIDEVIDVLGRATIEAVLDLSAARVAGEKHPGKEAARFAGTAASRVGCG